MVKEYIKRVDLENRLHALCAAQRITAQDAIDIAILPAADAREVVTCAKCRYYSEKRKKCGHVNGLSELVFPTDYCSYGSIMREVQDED